MSHLKINTTQIRDEAVLAEVAKALNLPFTQNAKCRFYHDSVDVDYVMTLPGMYDLGFKKNQDGSFNVIADEELFDGSSSRAKQGSAIIGKNASTIKHEYGFQLARSIAAKKGGQVKREILADGRVKLTVTGGRV